MPLKTFSSRSAKDASWPWIFPGSMMPPGTITVGRSSRAAPSSAPGIVLSQVVTITRPSKSCVSTMVSMSRQISSRAGRSYRIPGSPRVWVAHWEIVENSSGVAPACQMPFFTLDTRFCRWKCPGQTSLKVFTTAISGRSRSSSVRPIPLYTARRCRADAPV